MNKEEKKMMLVNMLNCYINETVLTNKQIEESEKFVGELLENIFDTRCCTTLKVKDLMAFEDYKNNLFIKADGVYQPKKTKLFRWYSEKQLKQMYKDKPL